MENEFELLIGWWDEDEEDEICVYERDTYPTEEAAVEVGKRIMEEGTDGCDYFIVRNQNEMIYESEI